MNYLDLYLRKNNCKRYDVHKKTGVSQQLLSNHTKRSIEKYSGKVLIAIANTLDKTPGDVLNELLALERENPAFEAYNPDELLLGLNEQWDYIVIKGAYGKEIYNIMKGHLSETETLGFELGSNGCITVLVSAIETVMDLFSNSDKTSREIEKKLKLYKLNSMSDDVVFLTLKQLDY
ncbi:helix-turn-helix domain-containing protein [Terrisporobacter sp.]|uniref:helix-turn-helix domain-containing protein n=1 Tax=Terrisporobacter sp. TaxID=1965305 RepID=UPI00260EE4E2|nr:helix-turn-helix domain-containing protein [Terrisporobacter sp.]